MNFTKLIMLMALLAGISACRLGDPEKRGYLPPYKYQQVLDIYRETKSIDVVRRVLEDNNWYRSDINEALYRLRHEMVVIEETESLKL